MFSCEQKHKIAATIERLLLEMHHPEMPTERPEFTLHVDGADSWSFADIEPNHHYDDDNRPGINMHNEVVAAQMSVKPGANIHDEAARDAHHAVTGE